MGGAGGEVQEVRLGGTNDHLAGVGGPAAVAGRCGTERPCRELRSGSGEWFAVRRTEPGGPGAPRKPVRRRRAPADVPPWLPPERLFSRRAAGHASDTSRLPISVASG